MWPSREKQPDISLQERKREKKKGSLKGHTRRTVGLVFKILQVPYTIRERTGPFADIFRRFIVVKTWG
jgi:hypothetical protein